MNVFTATARLGKDAETRFMPNGDPVVNCTAAVTSGFGDKAVTTWVNLSMFGKRYEKVAPYLLKGTQVAVSGELTNREYTDKDGQKRYSLDVRVNDVTLIGKKSDSQPNDKQPQEPESQASAPEFDDDIPF